MIDFKSVWHQNPAFFDKKDPKYSRSEAKEKRGLAEAVVTSFDRCGLLI
jgi:hypothetical protein